MTGTKIYFEVKRRCSSQKLKIKYTEVKIVLFVTSLVALTRTFVFALLRFGRRVLDAVRLQRHNV